MPFGVQIMVTFVGSGLGEEILKLRIRHAGILRGRLPPGGRRLVPIPIQKLVRLGGIQRIRGILEQIIYVASLTPPLRDPLKIRGTPDHEWNIKFQIVCGLDEVLEEVKDTNALVDIRRQCKIIWMPIVEDVNGLPLIWIARRRNRGTVPHIIVSIRGDQ